jgi:hypothetical protein
MIRWKHPRYECYGTSADEPCTGKLSIVSFQREGFTDSSVQGKLRCLTCGADYVIYASSCEEAAGPEDPPLPSWLSPAREVVQAVMDMGGDISCRRRPPGRSHGRRHCPRRRAVGGDCKHRGNRPGRGDGDRGSAGRTTRADRSGLWLPRPSGSQAASAARSRCSPLACAGERRGPLSVTTSFVRRRAFWSAGMDHDKPGWPWAISHQDFVKAAAAPARDRHR